MAHFFLKKSLVSCSFTRLSYEIIVLESLQHLRYTMKQHLSDQDPSPEPFTLYRLSMDPLFLIPYH